MCRRVGRRSAGTGACVGLLLVALTAPAAEAQKLHDATIQGTAQSGQRLTASASWSPPHATATYQWLRCLSPTDLAGCSIAQSGASAQYLVTDADIGLRIRVRVSVGAGRNGEGVSVATAAVTAAPLPAGAPAPMPLGPPPPPLTFDLPAAPPPAPAPSPAPAPAPVPTQGAVLEGGSTRLRTMRPAPTVRIAGRLTLSGARVTLLSVRAPARARITVTCRGTSCPRARYVTRQRVARVRAFERILSAGTRLEVRVQRTGYYGKSTVIVIRRGKAPQRTDRCLSARGARIACPGSS